MNQGDFKRSMREPVSGLYSERASVFALRIDLTLLLLLVALMAVGLTILFSASGQDLRYIERQSVFMGLGFCAMIVVAQIRPRFIERWAFVFYLGGVALLVGVIFFGVGAKGAQRWLDLGFFRFQPSEILKVAVPAMVSSYLAGHVLPPRFKHVCVAVTLVMIPAVLVGIQPDLGTALLLFSAGFFVLFLAGLGKQYLLGGVLGGLSAAPVFWFYLLRDYQKTRILTLLDPQSDRLGAGWNIIQSTTAIGAGGFTGKGWMQGTQSQLDFLPESHTDFIIAVLSEEFGFVGVVGLLTLYFLILIKGLFISINAQSVFSRLLAGSITLTFFVYVFVNVGMVSGLLPVVGVPLPMVSYGGTSIVTLMLGFGMLMSVSTENKRMGGRL